MNIQRAKEIAESSIMANVTFNGVPVYIQHVEDDEATARVYPLEQPENEYSIPLDQLFEK